MSTKSFEIRSTVPVCCVCVIVCCLRLCLCLCDCVLFVFVFVFVFVSRTFVYICIYRSLISFIYVSLTGRPQRLRSRARSCTFRIFFEWLSKGSLQKYMNEPCFSFGCVVRLPLFFFGGPISPGLRLSSGPPVFAGFAPAREGE